MSRLTTLLVDLDGTLIDPGPGILACYAHALAQMGAAPEPGISLRWVIGPPLRRSFPRLLKPGADVEEAVRHYRDRYTNEGIFDATVYPGIPQALTDLRDAGFRLLLCTAKAHVFAHRILDHFGLAAFFAGVYGADLDGRFDDKAELIAHILAEHRLSPDEVCMIGDRDNDVRAARHNGAPCLGILWGYGDANELTGAGATGLVERPEDLLAACRDLAQKRLVTISAAVKRADASGG